MPVTSGTLYASFKETTKISYTVFHTRLTRLADLRLIELIRPSVRGNTREVVLRGDPEMMIKMCRTDKCELV